MKVFILVVNKSQNKKADLRINSNRTTKQETNMMAITIM